MRLRLSESSIASRFKVSPKIRTDATFDFCNSITRRAEAGRQVANVRKVPDPDMADDSTQKQSRPEAARRSLPERNAEASSRSEPMSLVNIELHRAVVTHLQ